MLQICLFSKRVQAQYVYKLYAYQKVFNKKIEISEEKKAMPTSLNILALREQDNCPPDNCPPDNCLPDNCPLDNCPPRIIAPG